MAASPGAAPIAPDRRFTQFAAFDWSGRAVARPPGIALAVCGTGDAAPTLVAADPHAPALPWSRGDALEWLRAHASAGTDLLVGIDFSPALPFADTGAYFPGWADSPADAHALWSLVDADCAHEPHLAASGFAERDEPARHYRRAAGRATLRGDRFEGGIGRLRVTERRCRDLGLGNASSTFNLVGASQVGKASLTGMRLLHALRGQVPVWPFDPLPARGPVIVEIYTTVAARAAGVGGGRSKLRDAASLDAALAMLGVRAHAPLRHYHDHATDAVLAAAWLRHVAADRALWSPAGLSPTLAATEGWTFGVP